MKTEQTIFNEGEAIDLMAMLDAREQRAALEHDLLSHLDNDNPGSLLVMTMAVPGPIKTNKTLNGVFDDLLEEVKQVLKPERMIEEMKRVKNTGLEYYALTSLSPSELKPLMVKIEEEHPLGRLFDLDVVFLNEKNAVTGTSRTDLGLPVRRCFICDRPAKECGRSRRHSVEELQMEISERILHYLSSH